MFRFAHALAGIIALNIAFGVTGLVIVECSKLEAWTGSWFGSFVGLAAGACVSTAIGAACVAYATRLDGTRRSVDRLCQGVLALIGGVLVLAGGSAAWALFAFTLGRIAGTIAFATVLTVILMRLTRRTPV